MNLIKKVQENIFRHKLFGRGAKIVIGCSGGPDSVCLLDILAKLGKKHGFQIIIAHVNYGLRGKDSDLDEKLVKRLAKKYSLLLEVIQATSYKLQDTNLEEKLRNIRYEFFEKICNKHKAKVIAVGHNLDDQAETVLMRILRGSGLRGLAAIKFKNGNVIRPLLNISRKEILAHLGKNNLTYRTDKSNRDLDFTRNKIRHQLLPSLKNNFNPNIEKVLYGLASSASDDYGFIRLYASEWFLSQKKLSVSKINELHPALQREVIRYLIERHNPNLNEIELSHVEEILKILESKKNKRQILKFKQLKVERKGDKLIISRNAERIT